MRKMDFCLVPFRVFRSQHLVSFVTMFGKGGYKLARNLETKSLHSMRDLVAVATDFPIDN